jgi:hypothetical protein
MIMNLINAVRLVLRAPPYRYVAPGLFLLSLTFYAFTLPAAYTGGAIGLISLRYLNAELLFFAVVLAGLLSVVLTLNIYAFRASLQRRNSGLSLGAVLASVLPSSLCCTSTVPSLLAVFGASTPQIFGLTGQIQGLFATYELAFLGAALILLLWSLYLAAKNLAGSCPWIERSVTSHDPAE